MLDQGASKKTNLMSWDKIWVFNTKNLDPISTRYTSISKNKTCKIELTNFGDEVVTESKPKIKRYVK